MKYNHAMAEREYKREWKAAKLEMRKAGMQRKQIREAARAYRLEFNGERRFYRRTDVVPACEREDRPPKGVDTLFQESHSMHSPDFYDSKLFAYLKTVFSQYRLLHIPRYIAPQPDTAARSDSLTRKGGRKMCIRDRFAPALNALYDLRFIQFQLLFG